MVKKKFWPFAIYKWSWFDWPGPKERCNTIEEAKLTKSLCWGDAYQCCKDDIGYIDKYDCRFRNRRRGTCRFLVLMLIVAMLMVLAISIFYKDWFVPLTIIGMLALLVFTVIYLAIRTMYYRGVEFDLYHANKRIDTLIQVWPEIVDVVFYNMANDSTDLPPEPQKAPDSQGTKMAVSALRSHSDNSAIAEEKSVMGVSAETEVVTMLLAISKELEALNALLEKGS